MNKFINFLACAILVLLLIMTGYVVFVGLPIALMNAAECLEKGYPESRTTITLKGYCVNLEGVVTSKVVELEP